ncbi:MAG: Uma2 family endonuclease, partial [Actinobacteria bacterium]|nr:Uma2 family endonuclease [Actinomycetota bacterium]
RLGELAIVRVQSPIRLDEMSEPQPDLTVLRPRPDFYSGDHPQPADIIVVVEVADTTAGWDRSVKFPLYGRAGVAEAWLVDLAGEAVEVFGSPGTAGYANVSRTGRGASLAVAGVSVGVDEIFG